MSQENGGKFIPETVEVTAIHGTLNQEVIQITVDRLNLILNEHLNKIENKNQWIAYLGIFITMLVMFVTTDFKTEIWSIKSETWQAIFYVSFAINIIFLIKSIWNAYKSPSLKDVLEIIKAKS